MSFLRKEGREGWGDAAAALTFLKSLLVVSPWPSQAIEGDAALSFREEISEEGTSHDGIGEAGGGVVGAAKDTTTSSAQRVGGGGGKGEGGGSTGTAEGTSFDAFPPALPEGAEEAAVEAAAAIAASRATRSPWASLKATHALKASNPTLGRGGAEAS